jgi:hypothetical protein
MSIESEVFKILSRHREINLYQRNALVKEIVEYIEKILEMHGWSLNRDDNNNERPVQSP